MKYLQTYLATNSEMMHVTRVAGGDVTGLVTRVPLISEARDTCDRGQCYDTRLVTRVSSRAAARLGESRQRPDHHLLSPHLTATGRSPPHTDLHNITSTDTIIGSYNIIIISYMNMNFCNLRCDN